MSISKYCCLIILLVLNVACAQTNLQKNIPKEMLVGKIMRSQLEETPYSTWFDVQYQDYQPNTEVLASISKKMYAEIDLVVILGTWCSDTQREVPRFYKIVDKLGFPENQIQLIGVDTTKRVKGVDLALYCLKSVPTFIVYRNGEELGRIVEKPNKSLEVDLLSILGE